jgi:Mn-dependent DtxR family transcriptional regulator
MDEQLNRVTVARPFWEMPHAQTGPYLAFIHLYTRRYRWSPAEADMQEYFRVSPRTVHQMVFNLERSGLIRRQLRSPPKDFSLP